MKSLNSFINEAKKDLPKGNPSSMTSGDITKLKNVARTGERPDNLSTDDNTSNRRIKKRSSSSSSSVRRTRTRPSAKNTPAGRAADAEFFKKLEIGTEQGAAAENQAAQDMKAEVKRKGPTSSKPKTSSGLADLNREVDKVKPKVTTRRGRLSSQADDVIKGLKRQAGLERRMSAGYDKSLSTRADDVLKQIRATSTPKPARKPPTLPTFASKGTNALRGVETPKPGSRTYRGPAAEVNRSAKPVDITKSDVARQSNRAVKNAATRSRVAGARRLKGGLRVLGAVGAGLEGAGEFKRRRKSGESIERAAAGSATRVGGGYAGAKLAAGTTAKALAPLALAPFPGARPLYGVAVTAAGVGGYTLGADAATRGFDNFKSFQKQANKAYQRLLLPKYRTKTEEFVPEEAEFTVEFVQRLKNFARPVTNNPVVKAVTNNPVARVAGKALNFADKALLGTSRAASIPGLVDPQSRPSQKAIRAVTAFAPPGVAHVSAALTPSVDNSKFLRKNVDEPIMRTDKKIKKAVGEHPKPGSGKPPNYGRLYRDMQTRGMSMF